MSKALESYISLISNFITDKISAKEFESRYIELFGNTHPDMKKMDSNLSHILGELFIDVDEFCSIEELVEEDDIDEVELKNRAKIALRNIEKHLQSQ